MKLEKKKLYEEYETNLMTKIKVLLHSIWYPLAIASYWRKACKRNPNIDLRVAGCYTGSWIPWMSGMTLLEKYAIPPDVVVPIQPGLNLKVPYELVKAQLHGDWTPDIVLTIEGGANWTHKPNDGIVVTVATDAHCVDYSHARSVSDHFFNMHPHYSQPSDKLLHYAFCPDTHYPMSDVEKDTDAVLIGMPYPQRDQWIGRLRAAGVSVLYENGPVFDEYRHLNNRARIGLNWASIQDLNARVLELMAMRLCPVINRVPDLPKLGFEEDRHYLGFDNLEEAVAKVLWAKEHPNRAEMIANSAYQKVTNENFTYDALLNKVLKECGF